MRPLLYLIIVIFSCKLSAQNKAEQAVDYNARALLEYRSRNLDEALMLSEESLSLDGTAEGYYLNGLIYEAMDKDLRAVSSYEAAFKLDPEHREALFQKALLYLQYGDPAQSIKDFSLLIDKGGITETRGIYFEMDMNSSEATSIMSMVNLTSRIYYYRGQAYDKQESYDRALNDFEDAIKLDSIADFFVARGLTQLKLKKQSLAVRDFETAISIDESNQLAWYNLALIEPSTKLPLELMADNSFAPTLGLLASRSMENEDYTEAVQYLTQAIKNEQEPLHYINRGRAYLKLQKYNLARADLIEARKIEPTRFESLHLIGNTYFFQKEYDLAISFYNQYLTVDPQNAMVWYNAAMSYLKIKASEDACHYLNRANNLGMIQAKEMIDKHCR